MSSTVIIPAYNEEKTIGLVIESVRRADVGCDILVADNESTDNTYNEIVKKGIAPITVHRRGKGYAFQGLFNEIKTDYAVVVDADYTYPIDVYLKEIVSLLRIFDIVICTREWKQAGSMSLLNTLGNWGLSKLASILYNYRINDICSGMWGFKKSALDKFTINSGNGVVLECELFAEAIKNKCSIYQLPITYRARIPETKAKTKVLDGLKDALVLIKRRKR
jgi:dolichol-phosphate hexosyltransferase